MQIHEALEKASVRPQIAGLRATLVTVDAEENTLTLGPAKDPCTTAEENDCNTRGQRLIEFFRNAPGCGVGEKISWSREDLYERVRPTPEPRNR